MKNLHFKYEMEIEYSIPVARCNYTIKCFPENNFRQKISNLNIEIFPDTKYKYGRDGLNNLQIYGVNEVPHRLFRFKLEGDATTNDSIWEEEENENLSMIFRHPYGLNVAGAELIEFFEKNSPNQSLDKYEQALYLMKSLYEVMRYSPCTTTVDTSAQVAFHQRCGVCQDFAHVFISLLHLAKIPARYVTGLIVGEGASHAWVEILKEGKWYGLDPTHNAVVGENYIKIGVGRDAKDCMINRGIMHGGGLHIQKIHVLVTDNNTK